MKKPNVFLHYGRGSLPLPSGFFPRLDLLAAKPQPLPPSEDDIGRRIARPVGTLPLCRLARGGDRVAIAVSDVTRYSATEKILPFLLRETDAADVPRERVTLFVARGTHRTMTDAEVREAVGPEIDSGIRVEQSDPDGDLATLGTTSRGTKVLVSRRLMEHDRIVLTGTISFHYFAGFGGGRKALVPGCAGRETALQTHFRIFRTDGPGKHPMARPGVLAGNPVHEDIVEAVSMASPTFLVNTLLTPGKRIFDLVAGHWQKAHEEGCARYAKHFRVRVSKRYPLVIASAGGFPKDIDLIQSHKALDNAFLATQPGGVLILLAECADGFGSPTLLSLVPAQGPRRVGAGTARELPDLRTDRARRPHQDPRVPRDPRLHLAAGGRGNNGDDAGGVAHGGDPDGEGDPRRAARAPRHPRRGVRPPRPRGIREEPRDEKEV